MQWEVAGTDGGQERAIVVNADDTAQARRLAVRAGLAVESIRPVDAPPSDDVRLGSAATPASAADVTVTPPTTSGSPPPTPEPEPPAVVSHDPIAARAKRVDLLSLVTGGLGVVVGVIGLVVVARPVLTARPGAGLTAGLPLVTAGALQVLAAAVARLLAGVAVAVRDLAGAGR